METDRKLPNAANKRMVIVGPGGVTIDKGALEDLMRTDAEALVRGLALEIWRARRRFGRLAPETQQASTSIGDAIGRMEDVLTQHEVRMQTHDGEVYDAGLALEVLEAHGSELRQVVTETVSPTVTWNGRVLARAQVVVGPAHE